MLNRRIGIVQAVSKTTHAIQELTIELDGHGFSGINYRGLTGDVFPGDIVEVNTTALDLGLGTGGVHFVISRRSSIDGNVGETAFPNDAANEAVGDKGHIMKLRYTPLQFSVLSVEEEASPYHDILKTADNLDGMPVITASLHSLLAPIAAVFQHNSLNTSHLTYIMTDGGALPLGFSRLVASLKEQGLIHSTITVGHAFGGDLEAVNIYSALLAARHVFEADACIVAMGPGVVGTGTAFGTTALETACILDGANALGGQSIAVPRISFADQRARHCGISHHTLTALGKLCYSRCFCPLPVLGDGRDSVLQDQSNSGLRRHRVIFVQQDETLEILDKHKIKVTSMGRTPKEDPAFFKAGGAAGRLAARLLQTRPLS